MNKKEQATTLFLYDLLLRETLKTPPLQENKNGRKLASEISLSVTWYAIALSSKFSWETMGNKLKLDGGVFLISRNANEADTKKSIK